MQLHLLCQNIDDFSKNDHLLRPPLQKTRLFEKKIEIKGGLPLPNIPSNFVSLQGLPPSVRISQYLLGWVTFSQKIKFDKFVF